MTFWKKNILVLAILLLLGCSTEDRLRPLAPDANIGVEIIDNTSLPEVTAQLWMDNNSMVIMGEVRKRGTIPLNGYITIAVVDPLGAELWSDAAELTPAGPPRHHYRAFKKQGPSLPPSGSKIIIQFHKSA